MLEQVSTFQKLLDVSEISDCQWESLTRRFPELDDIVDRTAIAENLSPTDMRKHLIRLYQTYVAEWEAVESCISADILNPIIDRSVAVR